MVHACLAGGKRFFTLQVIKVIPSAGAVKAQGLSWTSSRCPTAAIIVALKMFEYRVITKETLTYFYQEASTGTYKFVPLSIDVINVKGPK